jgi:prepilin-type N-terminal cleavage/methylation domain-containing protein
VKRSSGFSLIEILTVVFILGLLVAVIVPQLSGNRARARDQQRLSNLQTVQLALSEYKAVCGQYPPRFVGQPLFSPAINTGCPTGISLGDFITDDSVVDGILYYPLSETASAKCIGYHIGFTPEDASNAFLDSDDDYITVDDDTVPYACVVSVFEDEPIDGIDGTDPVYDVVEPYQLQEIYP